MVRKAGPPAILFRPESAVLFLCVGVSPLLSRLGRCIRQLTRRPRHRVEGQRGSRPVSCSTRRGLCWLRCPCGIRVLAQVPWRGRPWRPRWRVDTGQFPCRWCLGCSGSPCRPRALRRSCSAGWLGGSDRELCMRCLSSSEEPGWVNGGDVELQGIPPGLLGTCLGRRRSRLFRTLRRFHRRTAVVCRLSRTCPG